MPTIFSANRSNVLIDSEVLEGLQSLAFRVVTEREYVRAVGSDERIDVNFGLRTVEGELIIRSTNTILDSHLDAQTTFTIVANLKKDESGESPKRSLTFHGCYVESKYFAMDAGGSPMTTYIFSATRLRED